jgi:hypothetical protein
VAEPDKPLSAEALVILRHAAIADLKADATELSKLYSELNENERPRFRALLFGLDDI